MVSPGFRKNEVTDLLDRYKAGELASMFRDLEMAG
jgi:hypothetical protein